MSPLEWFWYFTLYSMLGCLLEIAFARATRSRPDRKRTLFLPLCPVYGVGACLCLMAAPLTRNNPALLFLTGAVVCTSAEYLTAVWYERALGVTFWDYAGQRGNLWGRVSLPFSAAWGVLALCLTHWIHPAVIELVRMIPTPLFYVAAPLTCADLILSGVMLRRSRDRACLRWYDRFSHGKRVPAARDA